MTVGRGTLVEDPHQLINWPFLFEIKGDAGANTVRTRDLPIEAAGFGCMSGHLCDAELFA
jgi:hypothetical protein